MPTNLDPWLAGEAQTEGRNAFNQFECDGEHVNFGINFVGAAPGYLDRSHVMFYSTVDATGISTTPQVVPSDAWQSDTVIQLYQTGTTPYPVGTTLSIYRETPKDQPLVDFTDGSVIDEENLDTGFEQAVYGVAEMVDRFNVSNDNSSQAIVIANEANETAAEALTTANTANTTAGNAVTTANAASAAASGAVTTANAATVTANDAKSTADGIAGTAADALSQASAAVTTANDAKSTADGIAATANTALSNSTTAINTANAALTTANGIDAAAAGLKFLASGNVSGTSFIVNFAPYTADFDDFEIEISGITTATTGTASSLVVQYSHDGTTADTSANYHWCGSVNTTTAGTNEQHASGQVNQTSMVLGVVATSGGTNFSSACTLSIRNVNSTTQGKLIRSQSLDYTAFNTLRQSLAAGILASTPATQVVKGLVCSASPAVSFTAKWKLYGKHK